MRLAAFALIVAGTAAGQGRLRPPAGLPCDRDHLTSFTGEPAAYSRTAAAIHLRVKTDADTEERFTLRFSKAKPVEHWIRIGGETVRPEDWSRVESAVGKLKPGVTVTVWKCEGAVNPVLDWRLPAE